MKDLLLTTIPFDEFELKMGLIVEEKLKRAVLEIRQNQKPLNEYWTRQETSERLKISLPTLNELTKDGTLKSYRIGGRVLYKSEEVHAALSHVSTTKFKRKSLNK